MPPAGSPGGRKFLRQPDEVCVVQATGEGCPQTTALHLCSIADVLKPSVAHIVRDLYQNSVTRLANLEKCENIL